MSLQHESFSMGEGEVGLGRGEYFMSAEDRAAIRWAAGSLVRMSEVYARMPERDDSHPDFNQRDGHIVLGNS